MVINIKAEHEILFRGFRKDGGGWVEGGIHKRHDGRTFIIDSSETQEQFYHGKQTEVWIFSGDEVIPESVGQYTGLKDKNRKKGFHGDIVQTYCGDIRGGIFYIDYRGNGFTMVQSDGDPGGRWFFIFEIIGNLTDNPELMKWK